MASLCRPVPDRLLLVEFLFRRELEEIHYPGAVYIVTGWSDAEDNILDIADPFQLGTFVHTFDLLV